MSTVVKNILIYFVGNLLPQLVGFLLLPIYTSTLGPEEYGIFGYLQTFSAFFVIFLTISIERSVHRLYFDYNKEEKLNFLGSVFIAIAIVSSLIVTFFIVFHDLFDFLFTNINFYPYFLAAVLFTYFQTYGLTIKNYFQVVHQSKSFLALSVVEFILTTCSMLMFILYFDYKALGLLYGQLLGQCIMWPVYMVLSYKKFNFRIKSTYIKSAILFSMPMMPSLLFSWVINMSSRLFIEKELSLADLGAYALGIKISSILLLVGTAITQAYGPFFYETASKNTLESMSKLKEGNFRIMLIMISIGLFLILFVQDILFVFGKGYDSVNDIIYILIFSYLFAQFSGILNYSFYQSKKVILAMYAIIISGFVISFLNYYLIPRYELIGAGLAFLITQVILFILNYVLIRKHYYVPIEWKKIGFPFVFLLLSTTLVAYYFNDLDNNLIISIKIVLGLSYLIIIVKKYFPLDLLLGMINKKKSI